MIIIIIKRRRRRNIITIININNNNNNSNEDLDQLLITEPQYRFWNSMHVVISEIITFCVITLCVRKVITICVERLLHFALKILLHFASMLLHFALVLHFAAILITFCGDYCILRRNRFLFRLNDSIWIKFLVLKGFFAKCGYLNF